MSSEPLFLDNAYYNFETLAPAILGTLLENALCEGTVTYSLALSMGYDVTKKYRDVYPHLPPGTTDAPKLQSYTIFRMPNGTRIPMCHQWVNRNTVVRREYVNAQWGYERISPSDVEKINQLLRGGGFPHYTLTVKD